MKNGVLHGRYRSLEKDYSLECIYDQGKIRDKSLKLKIKHPTKITLPNENCDISYLKDFLLDLKKCGDVGKYTIDYEDKILETLTIDIIDTLLFNL